MDNTLQGGWRTPRPRPNATGVGFWRRKGFLKSESYAFKDITIDRVKDTPYLKRMVNQRVRLFNKAMKESDGDMRYVAKVIRKEYLKLGLSGSASKILYNDSTGRGLAFKLFNHYKETYGIKDPETGKTIGTPRPKQKTVSKKGTANERLTRDTLNEIKRIKDRLKFEKNDYMIQSFNNQLKNQQNKLRDLRSQQKNQG